MASSVYLAAKQLGKVSKWSLTNLEMQKLIYLAHMLHLGQEKSPLIEERFQAWHYGPVQPDLYQQLKIFGSNPVKKIFSTPNDLNENSSESKHLESVHRLSSNKPLGWLVSVTTGKTVLGLKITGLMYAVSLYQTVILWTSTTRD